MIAKTSNTGFVSTTTASRGTDVFRSNSEDVLQSLERLEKETRHELDRHAVQLDRGPVRPNQHRRRGVIVYPVTAVEDRVITWLMWVVALLSIAIILFLGMLSLGACK